MKSVFRSAAAGVIALAVSLPLSGPAQAAEITVTTPLDTLAADGDCSLREAIQASSANAPVSGGDCPHPGGNAPDRIHLPAASLSITLGTAGENLNAGGDFDVTPDEGGVTIDGKGTDQTTIDAGGLDRAIHVLGAGEGPVELQELTITGGTVAGDGGCLLAEGGSLIVDDAVVDGCAATGPGARGGAISATAPLGLSGATVSDSTAAASGGGIAADTVAIRDSVITGNTTQFAGVGGGLRIGSGLVDRSVIDANSTPGTGGGIAIDGTFDHAAGSVVPTLIRGTVVSANSAVAGGGIALGYGGLFTALRVEDSTVIANTAGSSGGGISVGGNGVADLFDSAITFNEIPPTSLEAHLGAGISNAGELITEEVVIADNLVSGAAGQPAAGGAIHNGSDARARVDRTLLGSNRASGGVPAGGAVFNSGAMSISDSTLDQNAVTGAAGQGGAVSNAGGSLDIRFSTFARNATPAGSGVAIDRTGGAVSLFASIIDQPAAEPYSSSVTACSGGGIASLGYNVDRTATCFAPAGGDLLNTDPQLQPLGANLAAPVGAPGAERSLASHAITTASPAFDRVDINTCTTGAFTAGPDQRGFERPMSDGCDSGAIELTACAGVVATKLGTPEGETITGTPADDVILALGGDDEIEGLDGNDRICGGSGDDLIDPGPGDDTIDGGDANVRGAGNILTYDDATGPIVLSLSNQTATGEGSDTIRRVEEVVGSPAPDDLTGDDEANEFTGGGGNDVLRGGGGPDVMTGGDGDDLLDGGNGGDGLTGGPGADVIDFSGSDRGIFMPIDGFGLADGQGRDFIEGEIIFGSRYSDQLVGAADVPNTLFGRGGNDVLVPGADAGTGDILDGGRGSDTAWFAGAIGVIANTAAASGQGADTLAAIENLSGGDGNDRLVGDRKDNVIDGGFGDDVLSGRGGEDTLSYRDSGAKIVVDLALKTSQDTLGAGVDKIRGNFERLIGTEFADVLSGDRRKNILVGLNGPDRLNGLAGADSLQAGKGRDRCDGGKDSHKDKASGCERRLRIP